MKLITKQGYDLEFGARPLKRAIQRMLEDEISERILREDIKEDDYVVITEKDGKIDFDVKRTQE